MFSIERIHEELTIIRYCVAHLALFLQSLLQVCVINGRKIFILLQRLYKVFMLRIIKANIILQSLATLRILHVKFKELLHLRDRVSLIEEVVYKILVGSFPFILNIVGDFQRCSC